MALALHSSTKNNAVGVAHLHDAHLHADKMGFNLCTLLQMLRGVRPFERLREIDRAMCMAPCDAPGRPREMNALQAASAMKGGG
jgi:hypothetical protein